MQTPVQGADRGNVSPQSFPKGLPKALPLPVKTTQKSGGGAAGWGKKAASLSIHLQQR